MLAAHATVTLAELNAYIPTKGVPAADVMVRRESAINRASTIVENYGDLRYVYRAPPEASGAQNIVAEATLAVGALTVANPPTSPGRTLILTLIDPVRAVTAGTVTVTGTVAGVVGVTEVFDLSLGAMGTSAGQGAGGLVLHGTKFFTAISAIAVAALNSDAGSAAKVRVGSSEGYVEYHSPATCDSELWTLERPVRQLLRVNEDIYRTFADTSLLVSGTDFQLSGPQGILTRLSGLGLSERAWRRGFRPVRIIYSAGYFTSASVPQTVKDVTLHLAAMLLSMQERGDWDVSGRSDPTGNYTRFGAVALTEDMQAQLVGGNYRRMEMGVTGARDFDLEAVS
jgi:hypothetical protein